MAGNPNFEILVARYYKPLYQSAFSLTFASANKSHQLRDTQQLQGL
jgi:hypothetical protein